MADAKSGRLPSRILTHQLLPNIISLLGRSIMNGWPSIHNRLVQYIRDAYTVGLERDRRPPKPAPGNSALPFSMHRIKKKT